jgi:hypothetical protein
MESQKALAGHHCKAATKYTDFDMFGGSLAVVYSQCFMGLHLLSCTRHDSLQARIVIVPESALK